MTEVDILIVGGGAVGLSLALDVISQTELSVAVTESQPFTGQQEQHPVFDRRYLALGNASLEYLQGIMKDSPVLEALQACPIHHIQVSDQGFSGKCNLSAERLNVAQLGAVAPIQGIGAALNHSFQAALVEQQSRLHHFSPDTVEKVNQHREFVDVTLASGESLRTRLLVLAEGGRSELKSVLGYSQSRQDYQQTAIIANVEMQTEHNGWAYERFTEYGPLALLPIVNDNQQQPQSKLYSLVWTCDGHDAQYIERLVADPTFFKQQLSERVGQHHGRCMRVSERACYPLALTYSETLHRHRSVVIGNAAQALHPIAGQGLNLGLRDVIDLVTTLKESSEPSLGDWRCLAHYAKRRAADRNAIMTMTNGLVKGFSNHYWPLILGRNAGLVLMNHIETLQQSFARRAMGYRDA